MKRVKELECDNERPDTVASACLPHLPTPLQPFDHDRAKKSALQILCGGKPYAMIKSFRCSDTETLFQSKAVARFKNVERATRRKLLQLHAITTLASLRIPPGNCLEALKGNRKGQHSVRINDQWRLCFVWKSEGAYQVEIVDYH